MESLTKAQGVPVSAAQASPRPSLLSSSSGSSSFPIRAPLTVDSDSDVGSYGSDNGFESDGVLGDEVRFDSVVEKTVVEKTVVVASLDDGNGGDEEADVSRPFGANPNEEISEEGVGNGDVEKLVVLEPFGANPDGKFSEESVGDRNAEKIVVSEPFETRPDGEFSEESVGSSNVEKKTVVQSFVVSPIEKGTEEKESSSGSTSSGGNKGIFGLSLSIPDRIITMKRVVSRRFLGVNGESLASPLVEDEGGKNIGGEVKTVDDKILSVASPNILPIATTPLVKEEDGKVVGGDEESVVFRPSPTQSNEKLSEEKESSSGSSNVEKKVVSGTYLSIPDKIVALNRVVSRRSLAVSSESLASPLVEEEDVKDDSGESKFRDDVISSLPSPITPVAKLSGDSDEDSVGSVFEEDGFSGVARISVLETLEKLSVAKDQVLGVGDGDVEEDKLQFKSVSESEVLEGFVLSEDLNRVLAGNEDMSIVKSDSLKNDHIGDLVSDEGPHTGGDAKATSVVESEVSLMSGSSVMDGIAKYSVEEIQALENMEHVAELYDTDSMDTSHNASVLFTSTTEGGTAVDSFKSKGGGQTEDTGIDESSSSIYFPRDTSFLETDEVADSLVEFEFVDITELGPEVVKTVEDNNVSETQGEEVHKPSGHCEIDDSVYKKNEYLNCEKNGGHVNESKNFSVESKSDKVENMMEQSTNFSDGHPKMTDEHFVGYSGEDADLAEESGRKLVFDSASFSGLLDAARDSETVTSTTITFPDDSGLPSLENSADLNSSIRSTKFTSQTELDPKKFLAEEEMNKLDVQQIKVKYLRLVQRLGLSAENSVSAQVLYWLDLAIGSSSSPRAGQETAMTEAVEIEANDKKDIEFSLNVLIIGKSGVGKSATINSIFGEEKTVTGPFESAATAVKVIVGKVDGIKVRVLDTPGLGTSLKDQSLNKKILKSIGRFTKKIPPDVVIYVDRLDMQSQDFNDLLLLRSITSSLGPSVWHKTIITLTHAASTPLDGPSGVPLSYEKFVALRSHDIQQLISHAIGEQNMLNAGAVNPVCLVENQGFCKMSRDGQGLLPNGEAWKPQLLLLCYSVKILSELTTSRAYKALDGSKLFGFLVPSPPLPRILSHEYKKFSADPCEEAAIFEKELVLVGRSTKLAMCAGLDMKSKVSLSISSSEQLHIPFVVILSIVSKIFSKLLSTVGKDY
ncbi:hypothetical protein DCAR_0832501 [Daucus carota subsp. sativus]|uniref:Uncharacterized protein n=1 Tax=Daucus carota subsp. sativus TaxID=79200 RepID=A0A175YP60_DAUCS|nr:PREDICTED: translocase of chloroplast 159, chloroplastic-like [Daucus carota subsp. sativus]WOH12992.1 hypothetical protein DCAR_0832501 [Daucus carota subsp. sativus]